MVVVDLIKTAEIPMRPPLPILLAWSLAFSLTASASQTRTVVYRGQESETIELQDTLSSLGTWGPRLAGSPVLAKVRLDFGKAPEGIAAEETFVVTLDGQRLDIKTKTSGRLLIAGRTPEVRLERRGERIEIDAVYPYRFEDIAPFTRVMDAGIDKLDVANEKLFFVASPEFFERGFRVRLTIAKRRLLGTRRVLFDRVIPASQLSRMATEDGNTLYSVALADLEAPDSSEPPVEYTLFGSYDFESSSVVNADDLPDSGKMRAVFTRRPEGSFFR
jgi:hypothetical protein